MSDRFPAEIRIGGKISRTAPLLPNDKNDDTTILVGLLSAVEGDGGAWDYGDSPIDTGLVMPTLLSDPTSYVDGILRFCNDQARNGEFEETEQFCVEHDIPFDRWSDHYCEYDAENVCFRPGMNSPLHLYADSNGHEVVFGDTVRQALVKLNEFEVGHCNQLIQNKNASVVLKVVRILEDACPELPPDLEPFVIVD